MRGSTLKESNTSICNYQQFDRKWSCFEQRSQRGIQANKAQNCTLLIKESTRAHPFAYTAIIN